MILAALGYADQAGAIITRYEAWQLQALGAALFALFVVIILASYDKAHRDYPSVHSDLSTSAIALSLDSKTPTIPVAHVYGLQPDVLPDAVVREYLSLIASKHTSLQEEKFLRVYDGKWMVFELELASLEKRGDQLRGQFCYEEEGRNTSAIFASFPLHWQDHLNHIAAGEKLRFKAKVQIRDHSRPDFVEAVPL